MLVTFIRHTAQAIQTINKKYAKPHLKTTRFVRVCLVLLRGYLLLLVGLLIFKFVQSVR